MKSGSLVDTPVSNGRRRINEKRSTTASPASDLDDLDEYEKPQSHIPDQEEAAADEDVPPKIKTTPKPLEEFVTPKAAPSSVYSRPRAPPRIARPVPVSAKSKFQYPVQKTATTSAPPAGSHAEDEEYYEEEEYDDVRPRRGHSKKRIAPVDEEVEAPAPKRGILGRKPTRTLRKPVTEKKPVPLDEEEDYDTDDRYSRRGTTRRRNPLTSRTRSRAPVRDDVDFVDDDYDERPVKRARPNGRKAVKKPRVPDVSEELDTDEAEPEIEQKPVGGRNSPLNGRRKSVPSIPSRSRGPAAQAAALVHSDEAVAEPEEEEDDAPPAASKNSLPTSRPASVRVVKRPFLPSRGGSPYLPRGLQPVGIAHPKSHDAHTTDSSMMDMFSTNSGVHLLEHGAPLLRDSGPRTTLPPRSAIPVSQPRPEPQPSSKATLDELYENDYDVTLNDALNPTLKPLSPHQSNHYHQHHHENNNNDNNRPYQSIYSSPSISPTSSSTSSYASSLLQSESFVYKNQSPSTSSSTSTSSAYSPSFQSQSQSQSQSRSQPQLTQSQNYHQTQQHQFNQQNSQTHNHHNNYNSDSYFSSTDIHRRTIISPPAPQTSRSHYHRTNTGGGGTRITPNYYDDDEYEY
ncbi:hypothetical protein DOY81_012798 [Sarcophaga bullata]|nr:hypothetical protein DOY81_012798 [Sarcophaga bullata]